jgi:hypothetical protein
MVRLSDDLRGMEFLTRLTPIENHGIARYQLLHLSQCLVLAYHIADMTCLYF